MKSIAFSTAAVLAATASAGLLSLEVVRQTHARPQLSGRADSKVVAADLTDAGQTYYVDLDIGTPPQKVPVRIDTGSSDLWTTTKGFKGVCEDKDRKCYATFDIDESSTVKRFNTSGPYNDTKLPFKVAYGRGESTANGTYISDTVTIAGTTLKNQRMGAAVESTLTSGVLGLGYKNAFEQDSAAKDPLVGHTLLDGLVESGAVSRHLFSLALGHNEDGNGTLTFGGVDTALYYDSLVSVPFVPSEGAPVVIEYAVKFHGLEIKGVDGISDTDDTESEITVVLDNGSPQIMLPDEMVNPVFKKFGSVSAIVGGGGNQSGLVDCATRRKFADARFGFKFPGKTIYITGGQIVRDIYSMGEQSYLKEQIGSASDDWDGICVMAFTPHLKGLPYLIGDPLLRHAYAVYDMDNKVVGMAQANFNSTKHNLIEIGKNDKMPKDKGEPLPKSIFDTGSGGDGDSGSNDKGSGNKGGSSDNGGKDGKSDNGDKGDNDGKDDKKDAAGMLGAPVFGMMLAAIVTGIMM